MRKMLGAALIGLTVAGGAVIAGAAQAQSYVAYYPAPTGYYDNGYWVPAPAPYYNGYYAAPGYYAGYAYPVGTPVDRYGPDLNGMIAADGHRLKCKLQGGYDNYGRHVTFRECW